jgi:hypothetical protein
VAAHRNNKVMMFTTYCSDALFAAMSAAQTKAINSFSFRDCLNLLNATWQDIYYRLSIAEGGYYSRTVKLTEKMTKLPCCLQNTIQVFRAQTPTSNRVVYQSSGYNDMNARETYHISGFDLWCPDAIRCNIWLTYTPEPPLLFFTKNNRDPKIFDSPVEPITKPVDDPIFNLYELKYTPPFPGSGPTFKLHHRKYAATDTTHDVDLTDILAKEDWTLTYISCAFPYMFISYKNDITSEYASYIVRNPHTSFETNYYNCHAYTGHASNVEFKKTAWNDSTGMGVVVLDYDDGKYKEMGYTPDTELTYPAKEMYRLLVATLAAKFAQYNESTIMFVDSELISAKYAFDNFIRKDQSSWSRIINVNSPSIGDLL